MTEQRKLRELPAVHEVVERLSDTLARFPRALVVNEVRRALAAARTALIATPGAEPMPVERVVEQALVGLEAPSLRRVINATGVVLHTNLGRAPLGEFRPLPGYSNLEYDLAAGKRGRRDYHVTALLERVLGSTGIVVNNNAAAVYLVLNELAAGHEVIVSRGELIEIGDGFRIPDIMLRSGAILREVGTTNKTHINDYREAFTEHTRLILSVHHSNFRVTGFTARPALKELASLAKQRGTPLYHDLGSGCLTDLRRFGVDEPSAKDALDQGVDLVSFSGDKLLGGPQAGIIAGDPRLVARIRRNPMFRALRADKIVYQALEECLHHYLFETWERIPALRMIMTPPEGIRHRAELLARKLTGWKTEVREGVSVIGGGATPEQYVPTWLISISTVNAAVLERGLRAGNPPVIARIEEDCLRLDLRTVLPEEEEDLLAAFQALS